MKRILAWVLAALLGANALAQLFAGPWWYETVPGVTSTGPYNAHFVKDIGAAYGVVALALAWRAWRPTAAAFGALMAGAAFLVLHAAVHVADALMDGHAVHDFGRDFLAIYVFAGLAAWLAIPDPQPRKA
ncbi:MAG TPA: hypothetical protein VG939_07100 [Caulobacteraceae bacterium]|nr:hypothetical protein [Caulobacteraceae bacterium]